MAKIDGLDGLCNIQDRHIICLTQALDFFVKNDLASLALQKGWSKGDMLQALASPLHSITNEYKRSFIFSIPDKKAKTKNGNDASPAIATYTTTMGLSLAEKDDFALTSISQMILNRSLSIPSYALILLSKVGIYVKGERVTNLLTQFSKYAIDNFSESYTKDDFNKILKSLGENASFDSREDIAFNAFVLSGILSVTGDEKYKVRKEDKELIELLVSNGDNISGPIDGDNYMGDINKGIIELITSNNKTCFSPKYNDLINIKLGTAKPELTPIRYKSDFSKPLQQIFYGAPGTGKSHKIDDITKNESVIRTTFHPDSDYSTFVGAYKPTMGLLPICDELGQPMKIGESVLHKEQIVYEFVDQAFLQAYVQAWKNIIFYNGKKQYLVIEEINRGNCAQIFGDLFQLLDRNSAGFSDYPINADKDLQKYLKKVFARMDEPNKQIFLKSEEKQRINSLYKGDEDIVCKVLSGEILLLPSNLYIWATMNTSDQSLFPIDSAFKRRWDWKYVPIKYSNTDWRIELGDKEYSWVSFQRIVNGKIKDVTDGSEDKLMGDFFVKAQHNDGKIDSDLLLNKIAFYLWNDVCKDGDGDIFKIVKDDKPEDITFSQLFEDSTIKLQQWMKYLKVDPYSYLNNNVSVQNQENIESANDEINDLN